MGVLPRLLACGARVARERLPARLQLSRCSGATLCRESTAASRGCLLCLDERQTSWLEHAQAPMRRCGQCEHARLCIMCS
eukprot:14481803-Alexandrium_andersonii.AAC.1